jgi:hypothetical protein
METPRECYEMAEQCERQAATVKNQRARELLLEVAAKWREIGDGLKADIALSTRSRSTEPN